VIVPELGVIVRILPQFLRKLILHDNRCASLPSRNSKCCKTVKSVTNDALGGRSFIFPPAEAQHFARRSDHRTFFCLSLNASRWRTPTWLTF
jgi:hypothetical protein